MNKIKLKDYLEKVENEMALLKVTLSKESEYKENMEKSHHNLLVEQRGLQAMYAFIYLLFIVMYLFINWLLPYFSLLTVYCRMFIY